jgi:sarcosine oxidase delta subunit
MTKDIFQFSCPCCGKRVEVDTRSGKARAVRPEEAKGGQSLDSLLESHKREGDRLSDVFSDARQQQQRQADRLAQELAKAKEAAKQDKDKRPLNPFDLD